MIDAIFYFLSVLADLLNEKCSRVGGVGTLSYEALGSQFKPQNTSRVPLCKAPIPQMLATHPGLPPPPNRNTSTRQIDDKIKVLHT